MERFTFRVDGRPSGRRVIEAEDAEAARNEAVQYLASILQTDPGFASEGHWTVHVDDDIGRCLLHVVVATVSSVNGTLGR